jgi:hypothetical protein
MLWDPKTHSRAKPAPGSETRGSSGAYPAGGQSQSSLTPSPGRRGCTGAYSWFRDTWRVGSLSYRKTKIVESDP